MRLRWPRWRPPRVRLPRVRLRWPRRRRPFAVLLAAIVLTALWCTPRGPDRQVWPREQILTAIRFVESGDRENVPDGDDGLAIGPYQIHEVYWRDAIAAEPSLGGRYQDCRRRSYAERVVAAYMTKWCAEAWRRGDGEVIARVHNGGPGGADKASTLGYWQRVRAKLP